MRPILYGIFVLSGAAALTYESVWSRYLGMFVGHAAYAQVVVLAIFLGSMALGARLVAARAERLADPLLAYAAVEAVVGIIALFFHDVFVGVTGVAYDVIFPAVGGGVLLTLIKWSIAGALLVPQSVLLGATFPLMASAILRRVSDRPGRELATLYFANGLGAAGGVLVAGFVLVPTTGLPGTVLAAGIVNLLVAMVAWGVSKRPRGKAGAAVAAATSGPAQWSGPLSQARLIQLLLAVSFGTAFASFFYEIAWLRMLSLVMGSATHSFELMLSAFILGLSLGALWVRRRADLFVDPVRALGTVQWVMGFTAIATLFVYGQSFEWTATLVAAFAETEAGYQGFTVARYAINMAIMLPSTFCAGITLPLITRILVVHGSGERAIGDVYAINTLGSIVGVGTAALILLPLIGVRGVLIAGAAIDMLLGAGLFYAAATRLRAVRADALAVSATVFVVLIGTIFGAVEGQYLVSGVFRHGLLVREQPFEILHYGDGRTATAAVYREPISGLMSITTNGKPDGSVHDTWLNACRDGEVRELAGDDATQMLAPLIALGHAPNARRVAVIGHGTGISTSTLLADDRLEQVTTIEIEPEVVRASQQFLPLNRAAFEDVRSKIIFGDAKTHFSASETPYDMIVSEPSNPWVSGVASLFTVEFYRHLTRYLTPNGVLGQWIHLYEMNDGLVLSVLAAIHAAFPSYSLFTTNDVDLLIVASPSQLPPPDWERVSRAVARTGFLCEAEPLRNIDLAALHLADRPVFGPLLDDWGAPNSDFYPVLDLGAERARFVRGTASGFVMLRYEGINIPAALSNQRFGPLPDRRIGVHGVHRLQLLQMAATIREGVAPEDPTVPSQEMAEALARDGRWSALLASPEPGRDWPFWMADFRDVERDRNAGMNGVVDEEFYRSVFDFLDRHDPPMLARTTVGFHHALATWDFDALSRASDVFAATNERTKWIDPNLLLEAGVTAKLRVGDVAGARAHYDSLIGEYRRPIGHLRRRLLESYVGRD